MTRVEHQQLDAGAASGELLPQPLDTDAGGGRGFRVDVVAGQVEGSGVEEAVSAEVEEQGVARHSIGQPIGDFGFDAAFGGLKTLRRIVGHLQDAVFGVAAAFLQSGADLLHVVDREDEVVHAPFPVFLDADQNGPVPAGRRRGVALRRPRAGVTPHTTGAGTNRDDPGPQAPVRSMAFSVHENALRFARKRWAGHLPCFRNRGDHGLRYTLSFALSRRVGVCEVLNVFRT